MKITSNATVAAAWPLAKASETRDQGLRSYVRLIHCRSHRDTDVVTRLVSSFGGPVLAREQVSAQECLSIFRQTSALGCFSMSTVRCGFRGKVNSISTRDHRVYFPTSMVLDLSSTPREQLQGSLQALDQSNQLAVRWAKFFYSAAPMRFSVDIINRQ